MIAGRVYESPFRCRLYLQPFDDKLGGARDASRVLEDFASAILEGKDIKVQSHDRYGDVYAHDSKIHMGDSYTINHHVTQDEMEGRSSGEALRPSKSQSNKEMIEKMKQVLADTNRTARWLVNLKTRDIKKLQRRISELEKASVALTVDDLLQMLDVDDTQPIYDLRKISRANPDLSDPEPALHITKSGIFQEWQAADLSAELLVQTPGAFQSARHVSAVSLVSSNLITGLRDQTEASVIYFFCGLHTSASDRLRGPAGMLRSLIMQAIHLYPPQLDFISSRVKQQLEALNFRMLCQTLTHVIKRFPPTAVLFCILDSLSFFEQREWQNECDFAVETLRDLVLDTSLDATLLLLVTSPVRTKRISALFDPENVLSVGSDETSFRGGATERQLASSSRRTGGRPNDISRSINMRSRMNMYDVSDDSTNSDG